MTSLKTHFSNEGIKVFNPADESKISEFQNYYNVLLPADFKRYFLLINGSNGIPLHNLYEFYNLYRINRIFNEFKNWKGVPDYQKLDFQQFKNVFIFGNYEFNLYSFGIELFYKSSFTNRIFVFCGKEYKMIANNFSEFIDIYLHKPEGILL